MNVATFAMPEKMNLTSGDYETSTMNSILQDSRSDLSRSCNRAGSESPVSFECKLERIIDFGTEVPSGSLVIDGIVCIHREKVLKAQQLDANALNLVGRMSGNQYTRTTERFEMIRPHLPKS